MPLSTALSTFVTALLLTSMASAQWDASTGHIKPTPGVPKFDPVLWNSAYKVTFRNVPFNDAGKSGRVWPESPVSLNTPQRCSVDGFETPASEVNEDACFYKNNTGGTFDFWIKLRGLAQQDANCYCYALIHFAGDFCYPGTSNGGRGKQAIFDKMSCPALHTAITDDGAEQVTRQQALTGPAEYQPEKGHYVAAMARQPNCVPGHCSGSDYHFLRKDASGNWSYKFPRMPATDRDLEGRPIKDPEAAPLPGHYMVCGYYRVEPDKMPIGSDDPSPGPAYWPTRDWPLIKSFKGRSDVSLEINPAPYNAAKDDIVDRGQQRLNAQDAAWERKRGTQEYEDWLQAELKKVDVAAVMGFVGDKPLSSLATWDNDKGNAGAARGGRKLKMNVGVAETRSMWVH